MTVKEIQRKIESILYFENRYLKNDTLNICDIILKSDLFSKHEKEELQKIKLSIEISKDPWLWNNTPHHPDLVYILDEVNQIFRMLE